MKVLLTALNLDGNDVGEVSAGFQLVYELAKQVDLTVLALQRSGVEPLQDQLPHAEVHTWPEPEVLRQQERLNSMAKLAWPIFTRHLQRWLRTAQSRGRHFDIAHQFLPRGPRYASPLRYYNIPYVIGPVGGALPTPHSFRNEVGTEKWFARLRAFDQFRFRRDPWLRASYGNANLVLGVAPYMQKVLADLPIQRFDTLMGIGIRDLAEVPPRDMVAGRLALLHVGRVVRTKGLRDVIRSLSCLSDLPQITLTSIGDGDDLAACQAEVEQLGLKGRVSFLGKLPRSEVEEWYAKSDALAFPSFRESMGGVLYEAQRWGLPIIAARAGGPDWIVDESCGLKVDISDPETLARDLATEIRKLADNPELRIALGSAGRARVEREGLWSKKAEKLVKFYGEALGCAASPPVRRE